MNQTQVATPFSAHPSSLSPSLPAFTTEQIQRVLDENVQLITSIIEYKKNSSFDCTPLQSKLQKNLLSLATIADKQQPSQTTEPNRQSTPNNYPLPNPNSNSAGTPNGVLNSNIRGNQQSSPFVGNPQMMSHIQRNPQNSQFSNANNNQNPNYNSNTNNMYPNSNINSNINSSINTPINNNLNYNNQKPLNNNPNINNNINMAGNNAMKQNTHPNLHLNAQNNPTNVGGGASVGPSSSSSPWTMEEHTKFIDGLKKYGQTVVQNFPAIAEEIKTKTAEQVHTYFLAYIAKIKQLKLQQQQQQQQNKIPPSIYQNIPK